MVLKRSLQKTANAERTVVEAAELVEWLTAWMLPKAGSKEVARHQLEAQFGIPARTMRHLSQRSRWPKSVPVHVLRRLKFAKRAVCEAHARELKHEAEVMQMTDDNEELAEVVNLLDVVDRRLQKMRRSA